MLTVLLKREGFEPTAVGSAEAALAELEQRAFDVVLSDIRMPRLSGLELVDKIHEREISTTVILMSAFGTVDVALEAMKHGAYDYVQKPFRPDEIVLVLKKAEERLRLHRENLSLRAGARGAEASTTRGALVPARRRLREDGRARRAPSARSPSTRPRCSSPASRAPARSSSRARCTTRRRARTAPFVAVNCGAIPGAAPRERALRSQEGRVHRRGRATRTVSSSEAIRWHAVPRRDRRDADRPAGEASCACSRSSSGPPRRLESRTRAVDVRVIAATTRDLVRRRRRKAASAKISSTGSTSSTS